MLNPQIMNTIMEKKIFEAPYLKVVNVKNDIITGSNDFTVDPSSTNSSNLAPGRRGMFEDDYSEDYDY